MTENLNLQRGLFKHLSQIPEVQLLDNVRVTVIEKEDGGNGWPLVHLSNGQIFRARLLVSFVISHVLSTLDQTEF
jgi:ubiquinone biosynthesis monooxygenase Coq6